LCRLYLYLNIAESHCSNNKHAIILQIQKVSSKFYTIKEKPQRIAENLIQENHEAGFFCTTWTGKSNLTKRCTTFLQMTKHKDTILTVFIEPLSGRIIWALNVSHFTDLSQNIFKEKEQTTYKLMKRVLAWSNPQEYETVQTHIRTYLSEGTKNAYKLMKREYICTVRCK
jgi:hypothetical protein